ncbi:phage holin family protein [Candidatus Microgenomates bacterium]|nr:MAG: phage holin family protein [Candidatus Microgenomates bacterium]
MVVIILKLLLNAASLMAIAMVVPGVVVEGFWPAVFASIVIGLINALLKPILLLLTLPLTIVTLGLFTFVINAILFALAATLVSGFAVDGFMSALIASLLYSFASILITRVIK